MRQFLYNDSAKGQKKGPKNKIQAHAVKTKFIFE